jgi:hypothetical protein
MLPCKKNVHASGWLSGTASVAPTSFSAQSFCQQIRYLSETFKPKTIMLIEFVFAPDYNADMTLDEKGMI